MDRARGVPDPARELVRRRFGAAVDLEVEPVVFPFRHDDLDGPGRALGQHQRAFEVDGGEQFGDLTEQACAGRDGHLDEGHPYDHDSTVDPMVCEVRERDGVEVDLPHVPIGDARQRHGALEQWVCAGQALARRARPFGAGRLGPRRPGVRPTPAPDAMACSGARHGEAQLGTCVASRRDARSSGGRQPSAGAPRAHPRCDAWTARPCRRDRVHGTRRGSDRRATDERSSR